MAIDSAPTPEAEGDISQIYATYIGSIMIAEQRRSQVSTIFASLFAAALASLGLSWDVNLIFPAVSVLFLATLWRAQVRYFQSLSKIKWQVVKEIEDRLIANPFSREHELIKEARTQKNHTSRRVSDMESILPRALQILAGIYLLARLLDYVSDGKWRFWETLI